MQVLLLKLLQKVLLSAIFRKIVLRVVIDLLIKLAGRTDTNFDDDVVQRIERDLRQLGYIK